MLKVRDEIKHVLQATNYSCGAASFASIFDVSEQEAIKLVKTNLSGTNHLNVLDAILASGIKAHSIYVNDKIQNCFWLGALSCKYPLYLSSTYIEQGARGRPRQRHHAAVLAAGG